MSAQETGPRCGAVDPEYLNINASAVSRALKTGGQTRYHVPHKAEGSTMWALPAVPGFLVTKENNTLVLVEHVNPHTDWTQEESAVALHHSRCSAYAETLREAGYNARVEEGLGLHYVLVTKEKP